MTTSVSAKASPSKAMRTGTVSSKRKQPASSSLESIPPPSKKRRAAAVPVSSGTDTDSKHLDKNKHTESAPIPLQPRSTSTSAFAFAASHHSVAKRNRCQTCPGCTADDCGTCKHCKMKRKFGGNGKCHMPCVQRYCHVLYPIVTPNGYRTRDRSSRYNDSPSTNEHDTTNTMTILANNNTTKKNSSTMKKPPSSTTVTTASLRTTSRTQGTNTGIQTHESPNVLHPLQPCNACSGCQQTKDCNECIHCLTNMKQLSKNNTQSKNGKKRELPMDSSTGTPHLCCRRRCFRMDAAMGMPPQQPPPPQLASTTSSLDNTVQKKASTKVSNDASAKEGHQHPVDVSNGERNEMKFKIDNELPVNQYFSLTEYLSKDIEPQLFDNLDDDNDSDEDSDISNDGNRIYGLNRPPAPIVNVCTGCSGVRDDELNMEDDHPVLLCDGVQCGREYHIACSIPPLKSIPDDMNGEDEPWYCYDCSTDGTTSLLQQYLNNNDKDMVDYYSSTVNGKSCRTYVDYRIQQELNVKKNSHGKRKINYPSPESELLIGAMIHSLALCDSIKLARTRGGNERRESLRPDEYVGKPIRLHDRTNDMYHTGRIVAYRNAVSISSLVNFESVPTVSSKDNTLPTYPDVVEYLIRFPAGKDNRKSTYHHWIRFEEHALFIGTTLIWARSTAAQWKPSILWLRTSLALISTLSLIDHAKIESSIDISKTKHKVCALVRTFGDEMYSMINVRDQCVDLFDTDATEQHLDSDPDILSLFSIARTELAEQSRVREWFQLEQVNPMGPAVLSSRDYWSLRELYPTPESNNTNALERGLLLPNVRHGLDRSKLVQILAQRGYCISKDSAASIHCTNVVFHNQTILDLALNASTTTGIL